MTIQLEPEIERKLLSVARETGEPESAILNRALLRFFKSEDEVAEFHELMDRLRHIRLQGPYTRDEMNQRR